MKNITWMWRVIFLMFVLTLAGCGSGRDGIYLLPGSYIQDGAGDLSVGRFSTPYLYDWNSDGKKDLLVGQNNQSNGYISFYENLGTDASPSFGGSTYVQSCDPVCSPLNVLAGG